MASRSYFAWKMFETARQQDERNHMSMVRVKARISNNPLRDLPEAEFMRRYRLPKKAVRFLCRELRQLTGLKSSQRVTLENKVLTALFFYATGSYQRPVGVAKNISQKMCSVYIEEVTKALNHRNVISKFITFPSTPSARQAVSQRFCAKYRIPGVIGCIDCSHFRIFGPPKPEEHLYYCRKHYHSINVQMICDDQYRILNVNAKFGGANHDSFIWENSDINNYVQLLHQNGEIVWLLGDSGYPQRPWLMTPILGAAPDTLEAKYNEKHVAARVVIENTFGRLKNRWRCLNKDRVLHYKPLKCARIIQACCVLHNLGINYNVVEEEEEDINGGGCNFPEGWTGGWFQSGIPGLIYINSTTMQGKGECAETDANDKFLVYDRNEDCYRCLVIHEKHKYVLQYKETYCGQRDSLSTMCESITGDAALYSMFRKEPRPVPEPCPFHPAPFTFTYSRGSGDCVNPPSRAESCTDDSRLLLRYMACPDVPGTESNVEELICLATWKEGSTRYLVGLISQVQRRNSISTDEDMYRCFVYKGQHADKTVTYNIAQSGDATCNGLTSPVDGSRTMKLTNIDDEHNRCHFPSWVVEHHKWFSLDHTHQYHFTTKNATLKIMNEDGSFEEKRLVCHSILEHKDNKVVKLVAHLTRGCESGHVCARLARREGAVLELQLGARLHDAPHHACADQLYTPHVTLITTSLYPVRCPMLGRYTVLDSLADRRRRRQQLTIDESTGEEVAEKPVECVMGQYDSASIGCGASQDTIEFQSACTSTVYTCYGSWREGPLGLLVAGPARPGARPHALCFIYTTYVRNESGVPVQFLAVSAVSRSCDRAVLPGVAGDKAYNLTINGTCEQSSKYNSVAVRAGPALALLAALLLLGGR